MYDFKTLLDRKGTDCIKWDAMEMAFGREDLMPFWVADGDFPVLPEIRQELEKRCAPGQTFGYTQAGERFIQAVIRWNREPGGPAGGNPSGPGRGDRTFRSNAGSDRRKGAGADYPARIYTVFQCGEESGANPGGSAAADGKRAVCV